MVWEELERGYAPSPHNPLRGLPSSKLARRSAEPAAQSEDGRGCAGVDGLSQPAQAAGRELRPRLHVVAFAADPANTDEARSP